MTSLMFSLAKRLTHLFWTATLFAIPVAFVAHWCGVEATWKSAAFVAFCLVWSDCLDRHSSGQDAPSPAPDRRPPAVVLTPAQVAAEAHKLTPRPSPRG